MPCSRSRLRWRALVAREKGGVDMWSRDASVVCERPRIIAGCRRKCFMDWGDRKQLVRHSTACVTGAAELFLETDRAHGENVSVADVMRGRLAKENRFIPGL